MQLEGKSGKLYTIIARCWKIIKKKNTSLVCIIFQQKVGFEHQLYSCKLQETPKAYPTAVQTTASLYAADEVMFIGW